MASRASIAARREDALKRIETSAYAIADLLGTPIPGREATRQYQDPEYVQMTQLEFAACALTDILRALNDHLTIEVGEGGVSEELYLEVELAAAEAEDNNSEKVVPFSDTEFPEPQCVQVDAENEVPKKSSGRKTRSS